MAACRLAQNGKFVFPITCFNGVTINHHIAHGRYEEIRKRFPKNIGEHINIPTFGLFRKLALKTLEEDFKKYSSLLVCLGCKLSAFSCALKYCLENNIKTIADGYTYYQSSNYPEQKKEVIEILKNFSAELGVLYINPVYNQANFQDTKYELFDYGISTNSIEGVCVFSDTYSEANTKDSTEYLYNRLDVCKEFITQSIKKGEEMEDSKKIHKIGAIIVNDKKILVVRKEVKGHKEYIIPGGRPEGKETHEQTLRRELKEELNIDLQSYSFFGSFTEVAVFENIPIFMDVYFVKYSGIPTPNSEIKDLVWIDKDYESEGIKLGSVLSLHVIPKLVADGLL